MKKALALILACVLAFSLVACGGAASSVKTSSPDDSSDDDWSGDGAEDVSGETSDAAE